MLVSTTVGPAHRLLTKPSPQRLPYNRAQQAILEGKILEGVILEGRASRQPGIQGSLGPEPVHGLLPVPLTQLLWVSCSHHLQ